MIRSQSSARSEQGIVRERRRGILMPAFVLGLPVAIVLLTVSEQGLLGPLVKRYLTHPVEAAELINQVR